MTSTFNKLLITAVRLQLNEILVSVTLEEVLRVNSDVSITPCQESIQNLLKYPTF